MLSMFDGPSRWRDLLLETAQDDITALLYAWPDQASLEVPFERILDHDAELATRMFQDPVLRFREANESLQALCAERGKEAPGAHVRVGHLPHIQRRMVRALRASDVGSFVALDGIVTKISSVRPRLYQAHYRCTRCGSITIIEQEDESVLDEPVECIQADGGCGRAKGKTTWTLLLDLSSLVNTQFIELQEPPELLRGSAQPERLRVLAEHDVAGQLAPGDRVVLNGSLLTRGLRRGGQRTPMFDLMLQLNSFERQNVPFEEVTISSEDEELIEELRSREDLFDLMARSIAPTIQLENHIKISLLLQLFGGVSRRQSDGTRSRGDIHILLVGDPGVAKSQLLHYMSDLSPRGQFASGQSSSKAGLTASAVRDELADGRFVLEAGALVLADLGLVAIDEMDKMNPDDRAAMHEALEQQSITIHKGGLNARLRTRCAALAAANPKGGRIVPSEDLFDQIDLPAPLFSRFDIVWMLNDFASEDRDRSISDRILDNRRRGTSEVLIEEGKAADPSRATYASERKDGLLDGPDGHPIVAREVFAKYVAFAKRHIHPGLTDEAISIIQKHYLAVRKRDGKNWGTISITPRALEALVRLSEASARVRLSQEVTASDAERACWIDASWRRQLKDVGVDELAMSSGKTIQKRAKEHIVLDILKEHGGRAQPIEEVFILNEAAKQGLETSDVERALQRMRLAGSIWAPRHGLYQLA